MAGRQEKLRGVMGGLIVTFLLIGLPTSDARADFLTDAGMGVVTVLANVVYMPAKLTYATLGSVTGGFAFVLTAGNYNVAKQVWNPSLGGDYVLTPAKLRLEEPIFFSGPTT